MGMHDLDKAVFYAPSPAEMKQASMALAKAMAFIEGYFKFPEWVHETASSADDLTALGMAALAYMDRTGLLDKVAPFFTTNLRRYENANSGKNFAGTGSNEQVSKGNGAGNAIDISNIAGLYADMEVL